MGDLAVQTALVTGGGSGVGATIAQTLADAGVKVVIAGRRSTPLNAVAANSANITPITADITDEGSMRDLYRDMMARVGVPDLVIANAGMAESAPFDRISADLWRQTIDVNLTGTFLTFREGLAVMDMARPGRLIAIASTAGLKGYPYVVPYCAAKHAVVGLVQDLAGELAQTGISVNAICPGFTETPMLQKSIDNIVAKTGMTEAKARENLARVNPQNRFIQPDEIAQTVMWLCSPFAASITGQAISVSGGEI